MPAASPARSRNTRAAEPAPVAAPVAAPASPSAAVAALVAFLAAAGRVFHGRADALRALALADVCPVPTNVLFTGAPGTAKTAIVVAYTRATGSTLCNRTLSAWTDDAALLGPVDVAALAAGRLVRATGGAPTLLTAGTVFLDELPRAGRGVRDLALSALADRVTPDGDVVPAHVVAAAANTRLVDEDDRALVDRFALRVDVDRLRGTDLRAVIGRAVPVDGARPTAAPLPAVPPGTIAALRARAADVVMPSAVLDAVHACAEALREPPPSGQTYPDVSERRWVIVTRLLQASAVLADRDVVDFDDVLGVLPFALDDGPESRAAVRAVVSSSIPAWVSALADLRRACDEALTLTRAIHVDGAAVSAARAKQHADRETMLRALADATAEHGSDVRTRAEAIVVDTLDACDAVIADTLDAKRAARDAARAARR